MSDSTHNVIIYLSGFDFIPDFFAERSIDDCIAWFQHGKICQEITQICWFKRICNHYLYIGLPLLRLKQFFQWVGYGISQTWGVWCQRQYWSTRGPFWFSIWVTFCFGVRHLGQHLKHSPRPTIWNKHNALAREEVYFFLITFHFDHYLYC